MAKLGSIQSPGLLSAALLVLTSTHVAAESESVAPRLQCPLIAPAGTAAPSPDSTVDALRPFEALMAAIRKRESNGNYRAIGRDGLGFLGAYQFTEIALRSIGWYEGDDTPTINDWIGKWSAVAAEHGVTSKASFLQNTHAQDVAWNAFARMVWVTGVRTYRIQTCIGMTLDGNQVTASGIIGGAHLVGMHGVAEYLISVGLINAKDPYGTPVSEYVRLFSGYRIPWVAGK